MSGALTTLVDQLTLTSLGDDRFVGPPAADDGVEATFGGHFLGLTAAAALATIDEDKLLHSVHGYFMRPGRAADPFDISVQRLRDGRSFAQRQVSISQDGALEFTAMASATVPAPNSQELSATPPPDMADLPDPESIRPFHELMGALDELPFPAEWSLREHGVDCRVITAPFLDGGLSPANGIRTWIRAASPLGDDARLHQTLLAYWSDESLSDNVAAPFGVTWGQPDVMLVSLDHAMWFHRPVNLDEWLFVDQRPVVYTGQRGLSRGEVWTATGELVASFDQEALLRF